MSLTFQLIGLVLIEASMVPYVLSILKGVTRPARMTYFIWMVLGFVEFYSSLEIGALDTIIVTAFTFINPLIITLLAIKYGMGGKTKLDIFCLFGALIGLTVLFGLKAPLAALILSICIDSIAILPLLRKSYLHPHTEHMGAWLIYIVGTVFNLLAINIFTLEQTIYPAFLVLVGVSVPAMILIGRWKSADKKLV